MEGPKKRPLVALLAPMEGPKPLLAPMEGPKQRKIWSDEMIKVLLDKCIEEMNSTGMNGTSLHKQSWARLGRVFKEKFNIDFNQKDIKNGFDNLKAKYVGWLYLKNKTGNLYNPDTKMFNLTQEEWEDFKKVCVGAVNALDGTLIHARVLINKQHLYRGRGKGDCYQNVLAICDFNMMFTFLVAGWEGVAHDSRILSEAIRNQNAPFPLPPPVNEKETQLAVQEFMAEFMAKGRKKIGQREDSFVIQQRMKRLSLEWQAYISRTHKLRKAFISVKGIYYQVDDQKVTWLTPHALQQVMPQDVDYKIMLTFLVLFLVLSISNFELINLKYPHIIDPRLKALAADLYALTRYVGAKDRTNGTNDEESELRLAQLHDQLPSNEPGALMNLVVNAIFVSENDEETRVCKPLFQNKTFFLGCEVPRESLLFVITSFGGVVSWEGYGAPFEESNQDINYLSVIALAVAVGLHDDLGGSTFATALILACILATDSTSFATSASCITSSTDWIASDSAMLATESSLNEVFHLSAGLE
ncbi:pescadillo [Tanacetum coccineum]